VRAAHLEGEEGEKSAAKTFPTKDQIYCVRSQPGHHIPIVQMWTVTAPSGTSFIIHSAIHREVALLYPQRSRWWRPDISFHTTASVANWGAVLRSLSDCCFCFFSPAARFDSPTVTAKPIEKRFRLDESLKGAEKTSLKTTKRRALESAWAWKRNVFGVPT
jgi:hypothetical protein